MTAFTITSAALINSATHRQVYVTVSVPSTPSQATNTIIYDPTTTPYTNSGAYVGTRIRAARVTSSSGGSTTASIQLNWDASTPVVALSIPVNSHFCFNSVDDDIFQPLMNQGGTGVSGKIGLTTLGLVQGDSITILLDIING